MKLTARDLEKFDIVDQVITEPKGGAHNDPEAAMGNLKTALLEHLAQLEGLDEAALIRDRAARFRKLGVFEEIGA